MRATRTPLFAASLAVCLLTANAWADPVIPGNDIFDASVSAGTSTVVFAPSSNTNGATVKTAGLVAAGNSSAQLIAVYPDGTGHVLFVNDSAGSTISNNVPFQIYLPRGYGLSAGTAGDTASHFYLTYDLN